MYYSLKSDCYFRKYGNIGYIVRPIVSVEEIVDESGALFINKLSYEPRHIDEIVSEICNDFDCDDVEKIKTDAINFFNGLVSDNFLNFAQKSEDFTKAGFDYSTLDGKLATNSIKPQLEESSSHFLSEYFMSNPFLDTFHIELTSKCNERCVHCYIPHENKTTIIDCDLMYNVLDQCKQMGVLTVIFSGGEPMLHPHFCDFLKYAKDLDFNVVVLSNLTLLTDEIIKALMYRHASCVNVSLYSMNMEVHDAITTIAGSFEKTKANIEKLIENNVPIQINCPIMKQNKDTFHTVVQWGQSHKCSVITDYLIMARSNRSTDNLKNRLTKDDLEVVIKKLLDTDVVFQSNVKSNFTEHNAPLSSDDKVCGVGMSTLCMVTNGDVFPCAGWQKYICGNIKQSSLKSIWNDSPQVNYLRRLRQSDFPKCVNCEDSNFCLMCMSRNSNENPNGDIFDIPQITCDAARIHHIAVCNYVSNTNEN